MAAALLLVASCGKSNNTAKQTAAPAAAPNANASPNANQNTAANLPAGSIPTQAQADAANPANQPPPEPPKPFVIAAGTAIPVILGSTLNSHENDAGETFSGTLASAITVDGEEAIPKGAEVKGTIVKSKKQGTFKGEADLAIKLTSIRVRGQSYPISSSVYADTVKGKGKRTAGVTGGSAAVGALIGGLAGGGKGAAIGAGVGAGGGLAVSGATGGKNVVLPAESKVTFKLTQPVTIER
jgi:hypothetical protein